MPRITGRAVDVDRSTRPQTDQTTGEVTTEHVTTVHVLDGREVVPVRLARQFAEDVPQVGDDVDFYVYVSAWMSRSGPRISYTGLRTFDTNSLALVAAAG